MECRAVREVIVWMLLSSEQSNSAEIDIIITKTEPAWPLEREQGAEKLVPPY
jgi:hypothetical protein